MTAAKPGTTLEKRLAQAAAGAKTRDEKAEKIIWANVLFNAGMGVAPVGINVLTFMGANATTIVALGHIYGFTMDREQAGALTRQIIAAAGATWLVGALSYKLFAEIIKVAGVTTLGAATAVGMALDGVLCGALSYALGYTAKTYFKNGCKLDKDAMRTVFRESYAEGRAKVMAARNDEKEDPRT